MLTLLQEKLGYHFKDERLLTTALTHTSYSNEHRGGGGESYERLEFLGDSILGFITAVELYEAYANREGGLTRMRANLVCEQQLADVATELNLGDFILFGKGEQGTGGKFRRSVLADVMEAILAAIYLDGGVESAHAFAKQFILTPENIQDAENNGDFKTELQELVQCDRDAVLTYNVTNESGPDHDKLFVVEAVVNGVAVGSGSGKSKKQAEQAAAHAALIKMRQ